MSEWIFIKFGDYVSYAKINLGEGLRGDYKNEMQPSPEKLHWCEVGDLEVSWSEGTGFATGPLLQLSALLEGPGVQTCRCLLTDS